MIWQPDQPYMPTGELDVIQNGQLQVLPVLGFANWKHGEPICDMGDHTGTELCGSIFTTAASQNGFVKWNSSRTALTGVIGGDSGGPVYTYAKNPDGSIKGVYAIGINEGSDIECGAHGCQYVNFFIPMASIMKAFGVSVLSAP